MEHNRKEPQEYLYKTMEIQKGGATFLVNLYLPTTGTGSLKSRLLRLMEQDLERQGNQTEKYTLLYGRLSNEDSRESTSLSIQHQEEMLRDYAAKQGFSNVLFLYDDGISGTKTNRPGFQKVMAIIREGQAATLIVTDLTRLYRNQSEANNLLEIVFPALGVRSIAITNNYDSATNTESDEDLAMFSNLFNEWYPRQTSRKINAVIQHKAEKGVRIASISPYGYQKDPADRFKIIPDPGGGGTGAAYLPPVRFGHGAGADCKAAGTGKNTCAYRIRLPQVWAGPFQPQPGLSLSVVGKQCSGYTGNPGLYRHTDKLQDAQAFLQKRPCSRGAGGRTLPGGKRP